MLYRKHHFHNQITYYKFKLNNPANNLTNIKFFIRTLNRKLYQHMKEVKACKLGRLLPYIHTNILKNNEKQVATITSDLPLSDNERCVLNKGLNSFLWKCHFTISLFDNMWKFSLEGYVYRRTTIINPILNIQCKTRFSKFNRKIFNGHLILVSAKC